MGGGGRGIAAPFLTSTLNGGEWSSSCPYRFASRRKSLQYPLDRRLAGMNAVESRKISRPCRESNPACPAGSPSLYRLSYRNSQCIVVTKEFLKCFTGCRSIFRTYLYEIFPSCQKCGRIEQYFKYFMRTRRRCLCYNSRSQFLGGGVWGSETHASRSSDICAIYEASPHYQSCCLLSIFLHSLYFHCPFLQIFCTLRISR
jgi:hypothetical protein